MTNVIGFLLMIIIFGSIIVTNSSKEKKRKQMYMDMIRESSMKGDHKNARKYIDIVSKIG